MKAGLMAGWLTFMTIKFFRNRPFPAKKEKGVEGVLTGSQKPAIKLAEQYGVLYAERSVKQFKAGNIIVIMFFKSN